MKIAIPVATPPMTHWTGTVVDYAYLQGEAWRVEGAYVQYSALSDHAPVVVDLVETGQSVSQSVYS